MEKPKYLLLDAALVESARDVRLEPGSIEKEPGNPLFGEDRPWEARFDNLYPNVIYDHEESLYRCWYNPFVVSPPEEKVPPERRGCVGYVEAGIFPREMAVCYAVSRDGVRWEKPDLGVADFRGSTRNNIVLRHLSGVDDDGVHGAGVFKDPRDPDGGRRYKMFFADGLTTMAVSFSPDGVHWAEPVPCPEVEAEGDVHNNAVWAPELGTYVGFTRLWRYGASKQGIRLVGRTESRDFVHWTKAETVFEGPENNVQVYSMPVFRYEHLYLGLASLFDVAADTVRCELAWSADTVTWHRACPGTDFIPLGPAGSCDAGCIYAALAPIVRDGEIRIYYAGSDGLHTTWRKGFLCLARLARDRFAGYAPDGAGATGRLTLHPLPCTGSRLLLNAETRTGGAVQVSVLGPEGEELLVSEPMVGPMIDADVPWRGAL